MQHFWAEKQEYDTSASSLWVCAHKENTSDISY